MLERDASSSAAEAVVPLEAMSPEQVLAELRQCRDRDASLMRLLGTTKPNRIEHDLRNVLNELALYKSLMNGDEG